MNCQEVEAIIPDLARGLEAEQQALAHVKRCPRCSERLAEEESLTAGLAAGRRLRAAAGAGHGGSDAARGFSPNAKPMRRRWIPVAAAGSIAAALVLAKLFTPVGRPIAQVAPPAVESVATSSAAPAMAAPAAVEIRTPRRAVRRVRRAPAPPRSSIFCPCRKATAGLRSMAGDGARRIAAHGAARLRSADGRGEGFGAGSGGCDAQQ